MVALFVKNAGLQYVSAASHSVRLHQFLFYGVDESHYCDSSLLQQRVLISKIRHDVNSNLLQQLMLQRNAVRFELGPSGPDDF